MTRRKSVCLKWTLVLLVVLVYPSVNARPQDLSPLTTDSGHDEKSTQSPIRYRHNNLSLNNFNLVPIVITFVNKSNNIKPKNLVDHNLYNYSNDSLHNLLRNTTTKDLGTNNRTTPSNRVSRLIHSSKGGIKKRNRPKPVTNKSQDNSLTHESKNPAIRKVITKWRDKTKYDDLDFSYESEQSKINTNLSNSYNNDETNSESSDEINSKRYGRPPYDNYYNMYNKPRPQYSEESHVYSTNIQVMETNSPPNVQIIDHYPHPTRPVYLHPHVPTPTPVITNVGYPKPWTPNIRRTTTPKPKPTKYEYNNHYNHHGGNYEVTTFEPTNSYTDRIVIRPEEYSPASEDCPTIFLTLNNTFQGEGKEACPDLNIAVNTNVINKNVVIESEEEGDSLFPGFGLGLDDESVLNVGDNSGTDSSKDEDYSESDENTEQNDSSSIEGTELANYHSANSPIQTQSSEAGGYGAASTPLSAITKPGGGGGDDDIFSFSNLIDFFRPALGAFSWLVSVNPFSVGLFPFLLAPLGLLFAGTGFAALFSPWFLPIGREAPKIIHVYRPEWRWDDHLKTWHLHSFPNTRRVAPEIGRGSTEPTKIKATATLFSRIKQWMVDLTTKLKQSQNNQTQPSRRRIKRTKRETWKTRVK